MTYTNLYFHLGLYLCVLVSCCHTKHCFSEDSPCISEFKLWALDANRQGFVEISLPAQPLAISQYSIKLMSVSSEHHVALHEDPNRNRTYAICDIALGELLDDHQPWAIVLLERGTVIDGVIYTFNYSDSRTYALEPDTVLVDIVSVDNKSLSVSWCGSSYTLTLSTKWEENACPTDVAESEGADSVDELEDEQDDSPHKGSASTEEPTSQSSSASSKRTTQPSSAFTKQHPTSQSPSASSKRTTQPSSASTKQHPTSQSPSASSKRTTQPSSAFTKQHPKSQSPSASSKRTTQPSSAFTKQHPTSQSPSASSKRTTQPTSAFTKQHPTSQSSSASSKRTTPPSSASSKQHPTSQSSSASSKRTTQPSSAFTKQHPTSQSPSASSKRTTPPTSASTKQQPTSQSSSASTQPTSPRITASSKQPTLPSSHPPSKPVATTEHGPTETSGTEESSSSSGYTNTVPVTASSPSTSSATVAPFPQNPVINEVSLLVQNGVNNSFIELKGPNMTLDDYSLVVFDGKSKETLFHKRFGKNEEMDGNGLFVVHYFLKRNHTANESSVAVALYNNSKWLKNYTEHIPINQIHGLLDSFIVRTTEDSIHKDILENLVPQQTKRIFTVKPSLLRGRSHISFSRCTCLGDDIKDPGCFILAPLTVGQPNNCTTGYGNRVQFKLTNANCEDFQSNKQKQRDLVDVIVNSVNAKCSCGLSQVLVKERKYLCGSLIFEAYIESSFPWQSELIFHGFRNFVHSSKTVIVGTRSYVTDSSCFQDCLPPAVKPGNTGDNNVTLTVAVVVSCVGVFLIVAMSVIIYIRRKKRSIVTFRLTNLGELDTSGMLHEDKDDLIDEDNATFRTISIAS
ncbi:uncharacterized protein LOC124118817 [Haliotis rufescens]|uniref:uncharacterized protein LOC124118817 n=1 Tax=Haliotis rufescens TaxID=6454 RepID=UPI00201F5023|nr:uncharacterized protein LOC124118817 [Haliotis rufescens]